MHLRRADQVFFLGWKKLLLIPAAWFTCVVLHNAVYGIFRDFFGPGGDEPFFFILAVFVIPLYAVLCVLYTGARLAQRWHGATAR